MKLLDRNITNKISDMITDIVSTCSRILSTEAKVDENASYDSKEDAKNRLKLVLMHDRSQLSPNQMEQMREELLDVISRYVEIDRNALDLCLEAETNTIALVANIPIARASSELIEEAQASGSKEEETECQCQQTGEEDQCEATCECGCQSEATDEAQSIEENLEQVENSSEENQAEANSEEQIQESEEVQCSCGCGCQEDNQAQEDNQTQEESSESDSEEEKI